MDKRIQDRMFGPGKEHIFFQEGCLNLSSFQLSGRENWK